MVEVRGALATSLETTPQTTVTTDADPRHQGFRGSGLAALTPQPAGARRCFSAPGVSRLGPSGPHTSTSRCPTPPLGTRGFEARAWRPSHLNQPVPDADSRHQGFPGSGLAALTPQPAGARRCFSAPGVSRLGPGGPHTSTSGCPTPLSAPGVSRLGPGGPHTSTSGCPTPLLGTRGFEARAWRPSHLDQPVPDAAADQWRGPGPRTRRRPATPRGGGPSSTCGVGEAQAWRPRPHRRRCGCGWGRPGRRGPWSSRP